ncbi:MAG: L,D-transpeptidase family protein [Hyphomicrobiaceae bacterium]
MSDSLRLISAASLLLSISMMPGWAVEPYPPEELISSQEAIVIAVRQRIDGLPDPRRSGELKDRAALANFYSHHAGPPLWTTSDGLSPRALAISAEIQEADSWGLDSSEFDLPIHRPTAVGVGQRIDDELKMGLAVLKYARHATGGRMNPKDLSLAIDRTPPLADPNIVLTELSRSADPAGYLRELHPKHEQFQLLRQAFLDTIEEESRGVDVASLAEERASKRKSRGNAKIRKKIGPSSTVKLSQRLLYNMEMWRWMPRELGSKYVWANIPEYKVRVVSRSDVIHEERIVAGKVKNKTPIFSDEMETIVFHPFWGVPNSIKVKEILPSLRRGGNILRRQNLKISYAGRQIDPYSVDWSRTDIRNFHVFQPPGRGNALGVVKFMFPNKHAVYMHDTPTKHLFKKKFRAHSHGCMRVRDPLKLAEVLLGRDKGWQRPRINDIVKRGPKNNHVALNDKVPVHVTYFTVQIDRAGQPKLFDDVYGHEKLIQMGFDGKAHLIVNRKPNLGAEQRRIARGQQPYGASGGFFGSSQPGSWVQSILGLN